MRVLVLSPHLDDAAFSCGLTLSKLLISGATIEIVNVCTISSYAPYLEGEGDVNEVTAVRRNEDSAFAERLIASSACHESAVVISDLGWKDAPLRWEIEDNSVLAQGSSRRDEVNSLKKEFEDLAQTEIVLVPLGIGGHIDHRLVHHAALLAFTSTKLLFYEDLPYASRLTEPEMALACENGRQMGLPRMTPSPSYPGLKREFGLCYPSQIATQVAEEMEQYAEQQNRRERFYGPSELVQRLEDQLGHSGVARLK